MKSPFILHGLAEEGKGYLAVRNEFCNNSGTLGEDTIAAMSLKWTVFGNGNSGDTSVVDDSETKFVFKTLDSGDKFLDLLSTHFLICNDKIKGNGEDSGLEFYTCEAGIIGAFDGCGGLGAKICPTVSDKTEAYLASRSVGAAAKQWFSSCAATGYKWNLKALKEQIVSNLELCQNQAGNSTLKLRGSMVRPFPSTIAIVTFKIIDGRLLTQHIWAGDSRTYVLDRNGLGQVSIDDIQGEDAMSNLTRDGALTNVISVDGQFEIHSAEFIPKHPCIILCATDGSFGYVSSPMEFEMMILAALERAENVAQWQLLLNNEISSRSGDDQTIAVAAFGFDNFSELKSYYADRYRSISKMVEKFESGDSDRKHRLWEVYKPNYYRYLAKKSDNNGSNTNQ